MKKLLIAFFIFYISACAKKERKIQPAFYHWQTNLNLTPSEKNYLQKLSVNKLYIKFFDVDWSAAQAEAVPLAFLEVADTSYFQQLDIVPTIFITNRTLKNISDAGLSILAQNIFNKINELGQPLTTSFFKEVQIDCDWSSSTKAKYFELLKLLKKHFQKENPTIHLSATIRLHQIKFYQETGIPPVDRGMLMFYNVGDLDDWQTNNSILDWSLAEQYLVNFDRYSLPLDVALPVFSWSVLYRNDKMIKLLNNMRSDHLQGDERFSLLDSNRFEVIKSTYLNGHYLYAEDKIRTEKIEKSLLEKSAQELRHSIQNTDISVSFYHLDTATIKHYPYENLERIYHIFH